jgi:tetratricopeptide (TPR) repeat protein
MIDTLTGEEKMRELAAFMIKDPKDVDAINAFTQFLKKCIGSNRLGDPLTKQWRTVVNEYARRISSLAEQGLKQDEWEQLGVVLEALENARYRVELGEYRGVLDLAGICFYRAKNYSCAVACWERCGAVETFKRKKEYCLAKARVLGLPDGLRWLVKLRDDDRILKEWQKAGGLVGATDRRWLEYIGPALQRQKRYPDAFQVYMRLGDTRKLLESFGQASEVLPPPDLWETLVSLVGYLIHQNFWVKVLDVLEEYFPKVVGRDAEKASLRYDVVRGIAYSELEPVKLTRAQRQRYERFLGEVELAQDWQQYLSPEEFGAAMERIGLLLVDVLRFYEQFVSNPEPEVQRFARERWVVTKKKHREYVKRRGPEDREKEILRELENRARKWDMRSDVDLPLYPSLGPLREIDVHGVPLGTRVEEFPDGSFKFQVGQIEARVVRAKKRVLLMDTNSLTTLLIDLDRGEISGQADVLLERVEDGRLSFEVSASGYSGIAFYEAGKPRLELRVQGVSETILFEL